MSSEVSLDWLEKPANAFRVEAKSDSFRPYPHQQSAWDALSRHFLDRNQTAGIVVVPTGGGKTKLATRWILENYVRHGYRVLWLAHRRSLLVQAYADFARDAHLATGLDSLNLIRVSSQDCRWSNVSESDHVVFSMIQSAATEGSLGYLDTFFKQSERASGEKPGECRAIVVVDEAHHAAAPSYLRVLRSVRERGIPIMGLTATPVRMDENENKLLWKLFDHNLIYEVKKHDLIEKGILATPIPETVRTRVELESEFTSADLAHLERFGELAQTVLDRLAKHAVRNKLIVEHYCQDPSKYGKTIVFAATAAHAQTLASEFSKANIAADYVDYTRKDSESVMNRFRDQPEPVVIANVEMLTEGFDAPSTKSVFIARPTRSEALLSQMIGRALRGKEAGGTELAYLVTFVDTWNEYNPLDTEVVIAAGEPVAAPERERIRAPLYLVSQELIAEAYKLVQSAYRGFFEGVFACLPYGWYVWEEETETDVNRRLVLVFDNQRAGFERLHSEVIAAGQIPKEINRDYAAMIRREYFGECSDPLPTVHDLLGLLQAYRNELAVSHYTFDEKRKFDPDVLAQELRRIVPDEQAARLREIYAADPVCRLVYRNDFQSFFDNVQRSINRLVSGQSSRPPEPSLLTPPLAELRKWPAGEPGYSLGAVWDAVTSQQRHFPRGVPHVSDYCFSDSPLQGLWGFFRYSDRKLVISNILNSPDVPRFVLEFLMYHEALHADMPTSGHNVEFRQRERRFTPSESAIHDAQSRNITPGRAVDSWRSLADQFLDTFHRRFEPSASAPEHIDY
ncbi:MAG: DEAD/DEAH box helicase [Pirellulales bacterium]